jgi:hypothetical protein
MSNQQPSLLEEVIFPDNSYPLTEGLPKPLADRFNDGKPQLSYILDNPEALDGLAHHFAMGTMKYSRNNYKKGLGQVDIIDSMMRHIKDFNKGIDTGVDDKTGIKYNTVDAILWNALILSQQFYTRPDMDNRLKGKPVA